MKKKSYKDFNKSAKKGIQKYSGLSSKAMTQYRKKYEKKTGKNASNLYNKEHFYSWVARNKIR